jgi:hypothetical protein
MSDSGQKRESIHMPRAHYAEGAAINGGDLSHVEAFSNRDN